MPNNLVYLYFMYLNQSKRKGKEGEDQAIAFLRTMGMRIRSRNFRSGRKEIDIIAQDGDCMLFVEVKNRINDKFGCPEDFVSQAQQERILEAAEDWILTNKWTGKIRFDIIAISQESGLKHIADAFF